MNKNAGLKVYFVILFVVFLEVCFSDFVNAISLPECITDSIESPLAITSSAPCGIYGVGTTRTKMVGGMSTALLSIRAMR
jgi:hypothetical protein